MADVTVSIAIDKFLTGTALSSTEKAALRDALSTIADNDSRLADARTPTAHAASHAAGGSDEITPAAIGAATASELASLAQLLANLGISDITGLTTALDDLESQVAAHIGPVTIGATSAETWDIADGHSATVAMTSAAKTIDLINLPDGHEASLTVIGDATTGALTIDNTPATYSIAGTIDTTSLTTGDYCVIGIKRVGNVILLNQSDTIS